jgi:hypothetical protein
MGALKTGSLVGFLLAQLVAVACIGCNQTSRSLQDRIPGPDPKKNPYLIVRRDGIEIVGMTPVGQVISVESVPVTLEKLPDSAWPYGLVVAVQDMGILSREKDPALIEANRAKLLNLLKELGIAADRWPSA